MKKKLLSALLCVAMVASLVVGCGSKEAATEEPAATEEAATEEAATEEAAPAEDVTIKVAAIETAYGSDMWVKVAEAFTAETGIAVELTTDKQLEDVIGPSMQGGDYPDVIHLATGREAALTEQFIKGEMIADITVWVC